MNLGYLSRTPQFSNVIDNNTNKFFEQILNEKVYAIEAGYNFANERFGVNVNGYYTIWQNKPFPFGVAVPDPNDPTEFIRININGMDALHVGGEVDVAYKISKKWSSEFMFSLGDWTWTSEDSVVVPQYNNFKFTFDAKGVHVGDAAQTALSLALRYEPIKSLYFKAQFQFFDRYYAQFSPFDLQNNNAGRESWKIPSYHLLNLFAGYRLDLKKMDILFSGNISNLLDIGSVFNTSFLRNDFIADATDNANDIYNNFDAQSATVMFGQGFRFNLSLGIQF